MRPLFFALALFVTPIVWGQEFSFIVAGDGRATGKRAELEVQLGAVDKDGVNVPITTETAAYSASIGAKFLLFSGDLVQGSGTTPFDKQLLQWIDCMKVAEGKVRILPTRGNHELYGGAASKDLYLNLISKRYNVPTDGPIGAEGLTFTFEQDGAGIIGLDEEFQGSETDFAWLAAKLDSMKEKKLQIFLFAHKQIFSTGAHTDRLFWQDDAKPDPEKDPERIAKRTKLLDLLAAAGCRAIFFGHDHYYDRSVLTDGKLRIQQIQAGTTGAPFYSRDPAKISKPDAKWRIESQPAHLDYSYGFVRVDMKNGEATIRFMKRLGAGNYVEVDKVVLPKP
ncbi:MAG TPA: metallophosphoesterase [Fimbriimonas sp.]|nr:metallophosphoesterase [Fimbriimonas sp.]